MSDSPFQLRPGCAGVAVPLADRRFHLRQWHAHETVEINLVLRGSGHVLLENRRYPLLPGHLVWLWPGQRHVTAGWSADMRLWVVEWRPPALARLLRARRRDVPPPADPAQPYCRRLAPPVLQRLDGLLECVAAQTRPEVFNRGLDFALFALWEAFGTAEPVRDCPAFHPKLATVLGLLADPARPASQAQLARRVGLSPGYLSALFQAQTGLSIPAYRHRLRLQEFMRRFHAHPEIGLLPHALDSGFGSYAQFHRVFVKTLGLAPRAWLRAAAPGTQKAARPRGGGGRLAATVPAAYLT